jgi:hypothetical protein
MVSRETVLKDFASSWAFFFAQVSSKARCGRKVSGRLPYVVILNMVWCRNYSGHQQSKLIKKGGAETILGTSNLLKEVLSVTSLRTCDRKYSRVENSGEYFIYYVHSIFPDTVA